MTKHILFLNTVTEELFTNNSNDELIVNWKNKRSFTRSRIYKHEDNIVDEENKAVRVYSSCLLSLQNLPFCYVGFTEIGGKLIECRVMLCLESTANVSIKDFAGKELPYLLETFASFQEAGDFIEQTLEEYYLL